MTDAERADWLQLSRTQNVGPVAFAGLMRRFGSARAALDALPELSRKTLKVPSRARIEDELADCAQRGIRTIAACEPDYPPGLSPLDPPPPLIHVLGDVALTHRPCVAMVGSRNASALGRKLAAGMAARLGEAGYTVVSGLARGIDAAAHEGSLRTGTVAVLGGGLLHIYPRDNSRLYHEIAEAGAVISERPLHATAQARDFPRRNRIVSGLSRGVVVVEAAERSGTLITARLAGEQGREVMACPGHPLDERARGCNRLIREGATLVESADHVLEMLHSLPDLGSGTRHLAEGSERFDAPPADPQTLAQARRTLLDLAGPAPTPKDDLIRESHLPASLANAALLEMELDGDVVVEADGRVGRK